jgi:serine/threonine-protein kinase
VSLAAAVSDVRPAALPLATDVADIVLASLLGHGASVAWFEPVGDPRHPDAHRISVDRGTRTLASAVLGGGLGDAVIARLALLCGLDLLSRQAVSGRCFVRCGPELVEILVTLRSTDDGLWSEVRILDDRGLDAGTVATMTCGGDFPDVLPPDTMVGPYRIDCKLGRGGMGSVYRVEHTLLRKSFAMKVLLKEVLASDPDSARRFVREARAAARVDDANSVDVTDFGTLSDGRPYLVMELLTGLSLSAAIARDGAMEPRRAVAVMMRVARALRAAHARGVIHRDLTPSNIFLEADGDADEIVKLVDFGAAKMPDPDQADVPDGPPGMVLGTPYYLSPEQAQGIETDERTDIYSFGVVFYELVTGNVPFEGATVREIIIKHITEPVPPAVGPIEDLPEELIHIIAKAMAKTPGERYSSIASLLDELARVDAMLSRKGWRRWLPA